MVQIPAPFRESSPQILILPLFHIHTSQLPFFYLPLHKRVGKAYYTQASSSVCTAPSSLPPFCGDVCPLLSLLIEWRQISFSSRATNTSPLFFSPFLFSSFSNLIRRRRRRSLGAREDEGALPLCCISFFETPPGWEDEKNLVFPDCWSSPSGRRKDSFPRGPLSSSSFLFLRVPGPSPFPVRPEMQRVGIERRRIRKPRRETRNGKNPSPLRTTPQKGRSERMQMRWRGKKRCCIVHGRPFLNSNSNTLRDPHYRTHPTVSHYGGSLP